MIGLSNSPVEFVNPCYLDKLLSQLLPAERVPGKAPAASDDTALAAPTRRRSVLVVDDVPDVTEMLAVLLTHAGYEVFTASSPHEAISLTLDHQFDLVVSDIGMPEMNGYELAGALRSLPGYAAVPMVAVTGYSMFDDRHRSLEAGFNAHVTKPIDPRAFLDLIEQL